MVRQLVHQEVQASRANVLVLVPSVFEVPFGDGAVLLFVVVRERLQQVGETVIGLLELVVLVNGFLFENAVLDVSSFLNSMHDMHEHRKLQDTAFWMLLEHHLQGTHTALFAVEQESNQNIFPVEQPFNVPITDILLTEGDLPDSYNALPLTEHKKELLQRLQDKGIDLSEDYVVNLNISGAEKFPVYAMKDRCPCLLANCSPFYITSKERCLSAREALRIQGFPDSFKQVVSERQMLKQCGNSMSIAVLTALFKHLLMLMHK